MKTCLCLLLLLALLSAGLLAGANLAIQRQCDQVTVQREILTGDPAVAEEIQLNLPMTLADQLFWNSTFPANRPEEAETWFGTYLGYEPDIPVDFGSPLSIDFVSGYMSSTYYLLDASPNHPLSKPIQQAVDATPAGEERTFSSLLSDWYDAWPLEIYLSGYSLTQARLDELFQSYFSIPVLPDIALEITVRKTADGDIDSLVVDTEHSYYINPTTYSVEREGQLIFTFSSSYVNAEDGSSPRLLLDGSHIPGGWGIYRLKLNQDGTDGTLETLYSLPEGSTILEFWGQSEGEELFLLTWEEEELILRIFDGEGALLQTMDLLALSQEENYMQVYKGDDFLVPIVYGPRDKGYCYRFAVVAQRQEGWELAFTGDDRAASALGCGGFSWIDDYYYGNIDMDFNGERLAVRDSSQKESSPFHLAVYSQDGLDYLATYTHTLAQNVCLYSDSGPDFNNCHPNRETGTRLIQRVETAS